LKAISWASGVELNYMYTKKEEETFLLRSQTFLFLSRYLRFLTFLIFI